MVVGLVFCFLPLIRLFSLRYLYRFLFSSLSFLLNPREAANPSDFQAVILTYMVDEQEVAMFLGFRAFILPNILHSTLIDE